MKLLLALLLLIFTQKAFGQAAKEDTLGSKDMKAVVVSGSKRPIEIQPDKTVLNVDAGPASIGQNALEYLRQAPGVVVDATDNIGLNGRPGVNVMIDGKATQLSAQDLAQLLKSIEASNIKQIELITNPSAKYDASGNAGIINIRLKKSLTNGFNGNLTGSHVQSKHAREKAGGNLNWRKDNLNFFFNGSWTKGLQHTIANNDRASGGTTFTQRSIENDLDYSHSIRAGLDYTLNKKSTLGVLWMKNNHYTRMLNSSSTLIHLPSGVDTVIYTASRAPFPTGRNAFNLNYNYNGGKVNYALDADYTVFHSSVDNLIANDVQNGAGGSLFRNGTENNADVAIHLSSIKGDFDKTFASGLKLETGFKLMQTATD